MASPLVPQTTARVHITTQSWQEGYIRGHVCASNYQWEFCWQFKAKKLQISPALGRALIKEPLGRFLETQDYQLEPGGDYEFVVRAKL
ncbi:MAG: DUF3146 family protein [Thermosynechococcus sp.]|uniref:DUF3146 family protein n=1 Tax=Thermosynechococcus sp. TaxID=2814275 RepID=UPI00391CA45D